MKKLTTSIELIDAENLFAAKKKENNIFATISAVSRLIYIFVYKFIMSIMFNNRLEYFSFKNHLGNFLDTFSSYF